LQQVVVAWPRIFILILCWLWIDLAT
jgi:hypothetical protein